MEKYEALEVMAMCLTDPDFAAKQEKGLLKAYWEMYQQEPIRFLARLHQLEKDQRLLEVKEREIALQEKLARKHRPKDEKEEDEGTRRCREVIEQLVREFEEEENARPEGQGLPLPQLPEIPGPNQ